ncbi:MAG: VCBS domain-containing protein [Roseobacter sp.]
MSTTQALPGTMYGTVQYLPNGQFVVAWNDYDSGGNTYQDVYARIFDADGTAASDEFLVNQHTSEHQFDPYITVLDDDSFMIAWRSLDGSGTSDSNISARIYDLTGQLIEEYYTTEDNAVSIDTQVLLGNDVYSDQDTFIFALDTATSELGANLEYDADTGHLIYDPTAANGIQMLNKGETLEDKFTYSLTTSEGDITQAEVVIVVGGVDEFEQSSVEDFVFI